MRILLLAATVWMAACGGRQSSGSTAVTSGGAALPAESPEAASPVDDSHAATDEPVDLDAFAREPEGDDPSRLTQAPEETLERDTKMMSYEEAMALPVEVGDITSEGGEAQLSTSEVARVMDGHLDEMYDECIRKELERGNELGTVTLDLAIRGADGMILGTTVEPGRRRFKKCLEGYLETVRFPTFASPRMGARYRFHTT